MPCGRKSSFRQAFHAGYRLLRTRSARTALLLLTWAGSCALGTLPAAGQQVTVETPLVGVHDGFHEHFGAGFGFGIGGRGGSFGFGLHGASGSHRSLSMSAPSVTVTNGGTGFMQDVTLSPFVTGLVPVVGYSVSSPIADRIARLRAGEPVPAADATPTVDSRSSPARQDRFSGPHRSSSSVARSTAELGDLSVAEIRRRQQFEERMHDDELARLVDEAHEALRAGRLGAARVRFRQAAGRAQGEEQEQLLRQLELLTPRE